MKPCMAILLCALPVAAQADGWGVQSFKLQNGLRVLLLENHQYPLIHLQFRAMWALPELTATPAGPEPQGKTPNPKPKTLTPLEPLALGMLDQCSAGRRSRGAFNRATEERGLSLSLSGAPDGPVWNLSGGSPEAEAAFSLLSDATTRAVPEGGELDAVRLRLIHELHDQGSREAAKMNFLRMLARPDLPLQPITESALGQIYLEDIQRLARKTLRPGRAILAISGDLNLSQARQLAQLNFGAWNEGSDAKSEPAASPENSTDPSKALARPPMILPSDRAETSLALPFRAVDGRQRAAQELLSLWLPRILGPDRCLIHPGAAGWRSLILTADAPEASLRMELTGIGKAGLKAADLEQAKTLWLAGWRAIALHPMEQLSFAAKESLLGAEPSEKQVLAVDLATINAVLKSWLDLDSARVLAFSGAQNNGPEAN